MATEGIQTYIFPRLWVYAVCAKDLSVVTRFSKMSPHLDASQAESLVERTEVCKKGHTNPKWTQIIHLDLLSVNKQVRIRVMNGSTEIGAVAILSNQYRDGQIKFVTVPIKNKKMKVSGKITLAWQLQYPYSTIGPPTLKSHALWEKFAKLPPRSRLFLNVYGCRNYRVGKSEVEGVELKLECGGHAVVLAPRAMKPRGPVWATCTTIPLYFTHEILRMYKRRGHKWKGQVNPQTVNVTMTHKKWSGTKVDGSVSIPISSLMSGRQTKKWFDMGDKGGQLKLGLQIQFPYSEVFLPGTNLAEPPEEDNETPVAVVVQDPRTMSSGVRNPPSNGLERTTASFRNFYEGMKDFINLEDAKRLYQESKYGASEGAGGEEEDDDEDQSSAAQNRTVSSKIHTPPPPPPPEMDVSSSEFVVPARTPPDVPPASVLSHEGSSVSHEGSDHLAPGTPQGSNTVRKRTSVPSAPVMTVSELERIAEDTHGLPVADPAMMMDAMDDDGI